jgi:hypothetical protein
MGLAMGEDRRGAPGTGLGIVVTEGVAAGRGGRGVNSGQEAEHAEPVRG